MAAVRFMIQEKVKQMAKTLRDRADFLDYVAERVDGADRDEMIVDPMKALEITRATAGRVVDFWGSVDTFEQELFGMPPPSPPASQMPADDDFQATQPLEDEAPSTLVEPPPPLRLSSVEVKRPRAEPIDDSDFKQEEPDKKKKRV